MTSTADEPAPSRTEAERKRATITTDRAHIVRDLAEAVAEHPRLAAQVAEALAFSELGDPTLRMFDVMTSDIVAAVRKSKTVAAARDPELLSFALLEDNDVAVVTATFEDGSSLVQVADALVGLTMHLAMVHVAMVGSLVPIAVSRQALARRMSPAVAAAVLRFHVQQRRIFGIGGSCTPVLDRPQEDMAVLLANAVQRFVIAHEVGHHVLGHGVGTRGFLTASGLPVPDDSEHVEFQADAFALDITNAWFRDAHGRGSAPLVWTAALLALSAVELMERSLYVRRSRTHPSTAARWERLMTRARKEPRLAWRTLPRSGGAAAQMMMTSLAGVCDQAGSITRAIPPGGWEAFMGSDRVLRDGREDKYYTFVRQADRLQSMGSEELTRVLSRGRDQDVDLLSGLDLLPAEGPEATLRAWGLTEARVHELLASPVGLTYHRLHTVVAKAEPLAHCDQTEKTFFAMVAAVLLTPSLERNSD